MERLSDSNLADVFARIEAATLVAPADLSGPARVMFEAIAANNRSRPWAQSHAFALADYCRVAVAWETNFAALEREGVVVDGKASPRLTVSALLNAERVKLARLLGLTVGRDRYIGGEKGEATARRVGAALATSAEAPDGDLLA